MQKEKNRNKKVKKSCRKKQRKKENIQKYNR